MKAKTNFFYILFCLYTFSFSQTKVYEKVKVPQGFKADLDQTYTKIKGWKGKIDTYTNPNIDKPTPIILNIHGGGWRNGVKESHKGFGSFFKKGYAVANVEYRLSHQGKAPAAIEDIRCALIYLFKNSKKLNIDTNKIIIMGGSAGGHLALMAGFLGKNKKFDTNCTYHNDFKIAAIIDKYGVTDLLPFDDWKSAKLWLGNNFSNNEFTKSVSPINYVTKNSPPVFIVHGNKDTTVPYQQSVKLYEKLTTLGVDCELMTIENGGHGKFTKEQKKAYKKRIFEFLKKIGVEP